MLRGEGLGIHWPRSSLVLRRPLLTAKDLALRRSAMRILWYQVCVFGGNHLPEFVPSGAGMLLKGKQNRRAWVSGCMFGYIPDTCT